MPKVEAAAHRFKLRHAQRPLRREVSRGREGKPGKERDPLTQEFPITSLTRLDLQEVGVTSERIKTIPAEQMRRLASKMEDSYLDNGFWEDLDIHASFLLEDQ